MVMSPQIMNQKKFDRQKYSHLRNAARDLGGVARQIAEVVQEYIEEVRSFDYALYARPESADASFSDTTRHAHKERSVASGP